jgi:hypothetical protein
MSNKEKNIIITETVLNFLSFIADNYKNVHLEQLPHIGAKFLESEYGKINIDNEKYSPEFMTM